MLKRAHGDLLEYEIAANRFTTHLRVLCSVPSHRTIVADFDGKFKLQVIGTTQFNALLVPFAERYGFYNV